MSRLEDLQPHANVRGITPDGVATVVSLQWYGADALELTYKDPSGRVANQLLFRHDEARIEIVAAGRPWSFDGDGALFRLVSEAHRIHLAHLFDPLLAVHTSLVEPLPHQITAVYEAMLPRQPLRFLLADDPGAGKTIMAGLLIKELIVRGDLKRCLIVCPGSLAEQWQDELYRRFQLPFEIATNDKMESARTGNWFVENDFVIARLDKLSRSEDLQAKLSAPDCRYDLVVCDEAHKLSATFFGGEIKYTKRYRLGQLLSSLTRHFLLMTATPHNGKEEDFQLFLALLDGDRFEGRFRDGVHAVDVSDLMRRMVKESLLRFDGRPLFPERIAYTVPYKLSDAEARLYKEVTEYVREEFNRAEKLDNDKRAGTVGFALTILQRRLASSPEAIYQSLRRRRERLEKRLRELELLQRGIPGTAGVPPASGTAGVPPAFFPELSSDDVEDMEDAPENEVAATEEEILDQATAASTIQELQAEIAILTGLETLAADVRRSGEDTKWCELANVLTSVFTPAAIACEVGEESPPYGSGVIPPPTPSPRQKIVIFTEHRDTLNYLEQRISTLLGSPVAVMVIHGGMGREERRKAQESFLHDPDVKVLLATDAAGEGINLQRAHLMMNYDLPWNPNRLEQRFGRIHRIGQTEVCHLWNLVADETREGDVYRTLLDKLEEARRALGGRVFDVLGKLQFAGRPLRDLLIEAVRYGERPEIRARLNQAIAQAVDRPHLQDLIEERALAQDVMDATRVARVREEMERAEACRLQPHYVESFFLEAFRLLGGTVRQREPRRYEVTHVPAPVRNRDRLIGTGGPVLGRYERAVFEKELIAPPGQPLAAFVCPGHALLEATLDLTLERHRDLLRRGTVLVDDRDPGTSPRVLFYLEHAVQDASVTRSGDRRTISKRMLYVEASPTARLGTAGVPPAPGTAGVPPAPGTAGIPPAPSSSSPPADPWYSRGYLPHYNEPGRLQSITLRLFDAVPDRLLNQWRAELNWIEGLPGNDPREIELRERLAKYEDAGHGACFLRDARIAALVQEALLYFDGKRYRLIAWCIMPNHVHVMVGTLFDFLGTGTIQEASTPYSLSSIVHSWKSFTAHEANKLLGRTGDFWFRDYYDRYIRGQKHFHACREYIEQNPVKAGLVVERTMWKWSSAGGTPAVPGVVPGAGGTPAVPGVVPGAGGTPAVPGVVPIFRHIQYAPYLDYRPLRDDEVQGEVLLSRPECAWISRALEQQALAHAIANVVPEHVTEVRDRRLAWVTKTRAAVQDRLTKEITYWDHRAEQLKLQEQAGKTNARLNSQEARRHADELQTRLQRRLAELDREAQVSALPPVALGGLVVVPAGLLAAVAGSSAQPVSTQTRDTQLAATRARAIIMDVERRLGYDPIDRELDKLGYDIESRVPGTGRLRFIEVKGRITGAATVTVTKNEILTSLNKPDDYILAIVEFLDLPAATAAQAGGENHRVHYVRQPFRREPDFGVTSVNYDFAELLARAEVPR